MSISRLQLAAALLEYDNDDDEPSSSRPHISHRDSALFKPFAPKPLDGWDLPSNGRRHDGDEGRAQPRRRLQPSPVPSVRPHNGQMMNGPYPSMSSRRLDRLLDPDYDESHVQPEAQTLPEHVLDTPHWQSSRPNAPPQITLPHITPPEPDIQSPLDTVSSSPAIPSGSFFPRPPLPLPLRDADVGHLTPEAITSPLQGRAASIHLSLSGNNSAQSQLSEREQVEYFGGADDVEEVLRRSEQVRSLAEGALRSPRMIPLPPSPGNTLNAMTSRPISSLSRLSSSKSIFHANADITRDDGPNPFALPPPPAELGSRFDPKRSIDLGSGSRPSMSNRVSFADPTGRRNSLGDMTGIDQDFGPAMPPRQRRMSGTPAQALASLPSDRPASKTWDDIPTPNEFGRPLMPNRYSTMSNLSSLRDKRTSVLRPQTLFMPRPLSGILPPPSPPKNVPDGYTLGDKPLPPGSRSSILSLANPRPGLPMSLSMRTFRDSLLADIPREDVVEAQGEQEGELEPEAEDERRPGKLYGTSLMDQLEARKAAQRSRQRVFVGDSRPAMMARPSQGQEVESIQPDTAQRDTILQSKSNVDLAASHDRISKSRSVFGVDQLWEKELAKLKVRQEEEAREAAQQAAREALEGKKRGKKDKGKGKVTPTPIEPELLLPSSPVRTTMELGHGLPISPIKRLSGGPPRLSYSPAKAPPTMIPHLAGDERRAAAGKNDGWSSDGEDEKQVPSPEVDDDDSDEDVPLSRLAPKRSELDDDDSDEDVPLSKLATGKPNENRPVKLTSPTLNLDTAEFGTSSLGLDIPGLTPTTAAAQDDDVPLALRRPATQLLDAEDDIPLGLKRQSAFASPYGDAYLGSYPSMGMPSLPSMPYGMPYPQYPPVNPYGYPVYQYPPYAYGVSPYPRPESVHEYMNPNFGMPPSAAQQQAAVSKIDSWRKEVAVAPAGGSSGSSGPGVA
ncbi:hypothetical protein BD324DRAFT_640007 [Kockovaella imperatae]|uniref:Uncharacterized protein n=1 Tax=Kockovaella imperatae TaxID=4999 RepID=A0A1Y1U780_9TREE|nr:hypothetical protein BD324DRAFT_640007 [Kockovaella imperatae]ORX33404.1 hypothetical protein BD324DRAFT_640007 [Kockovaella imperatae]